MEFSTSRGTQAPAPARVASNAPSGTSGSSNKSKNNGAWKTSPMWLRVALLVLLFAGTIIILALLVLIYFGGPRQDNYLNKNEEQAVFLTNGQVYFGKIKTVNQQYIDLQNIYYLNVNQQVQPNQSSSTSTTSSSSSSTSNQSVSLVKLGCELHGPEDEMIINTSQVTFWENLKSTGQVSKAIAQWQQQNPNGQTCSTSSSSSSSSSTSSNK